MIVLDNNNSSNGLKLFYYTYIDPLIVDNVNCNTIRNNLSVILNNSFMIKHRKYQTLWKEVCRLFEIGIEIAIDEFFDKRSKHNKNGKFTVKKKCKNCVNDIKCRKCEEKDVYSLQKYKLENFEEEIIKLYNGNNNGYGMNENTFETKNEDKNNDKISVDSEHGGLFIKDITMKDSCPYEMNSCFNTTSINKLNENYNKHNSNNNKIINEISSSQSLDSFDSNNELSKVSCLNGINNRPTRQSSNLSMTSMNSNSYYNKKFKMKEFQFHFSKRENIDKYVLRKFRKFLKETYKQSQDKQIISILSKDKFWYDFIAINLLPPFVYPYECMEFKSFNTTYMSWMFNHSYSIELYNIFINSNLQSLLDYFCHKYKLQQNDDDYLSLKNYLNTMAIVFSPNRTTTTESTMNTKIPMDYVFDKNSSLNNMNSSYNVVGKTSQLFNVSKTSNNSLLNIVNVNIGNDYEINLDNNNSINNQLYVTNNKDNSFIRENTSIEINPSFMNNNNNSNNDTLLDDDEDDHPFYMKDEIDFSLMNEYNNFY